MQRGALFLESAVINMEFPAEDSEVLPGILWGAIDAFPSPAYWAYQVIARRILGNKINYKLGFTLKEEVGACLLGGHGIPASVGIAAYQHVKARGAFGDRVPDEANIFEWLSEPLHVSGKNVRYRFARQKSRYLAAALQKLEDESAPTNSGQSLRNWLLAIPGIGLKTASWTARNWMDADDVAILDIHVLRAGILGGFFRPNLTVERDYLKLEEQFLSFSKGLGVRASELDAVIWLEMMSSPRTVHGILESQSENLSVKKISTSPRRSKQRHSDANQTALLI
jgi:N-glycosylase/DNA lyase